MNKLIKTIKIINKDSAAITEELNKSKLRNSAIINMKLKDVYPEVKGNNTKNIIFAVWENVLLHASRKYSKTWGTLLTELDKLLKVIYPNKETLRGVLVKLRKPLTDFKKWDKMIYDKTIIIMGMSKEESNELAEEYKTKVKAKNMSRGDQVPIYVEDIYELIDNLIKSKNAYELTLAVEIATGSRSIEIFKISEYKEIEGNPEQIQVCGIAKDMKKNDSSGVVLTRNLVRLKSKQVIEAVNEIRKLINVEGTNEDISRRTNKYLNKKQKEYIIPLIEKNASEEIKNSEQYKNYIKKFTSHHNRYLFANISYMVNAKNKDIPLNVYAQDQLGHLGASSTNSYLGINVKFREESTRDINPELKEEVKEEVKELIDETKQIDQVVDLNGFKNSFSKRETEESKINKVIGAMELYISLKKKIPRQSDLGRALSMGGNIMTKSYGKARELGLINNYNATNR